MRFLPLLALLLAALARAEPFDPQPRMVVDGPWGGAITPPQAFDSTKRLIFDLDGDGLPEIVGTNDNGRVYVVRGIDGRIVSELSTPRPEPWGARDLNDVAVGDVNGNGRIDLVITNGAGVITLFELRGEQTGLDELQWDRLWTKSINPRVLWPGIEQARPGYDWGTVYPGMDGGAYLADVDKDGKLEIFVQHDNQPGFFALRHDGSIRWAHNWSDGNANPWVDDLDGDGRLEVVFVSDGGGVYIVDAATGGWRGGFHAKAAPGGCAAQPGAISVSPGVVDLDGDGRKEIVFGSRQANGTEADSASPEWRQAQDTRIYAVNADGSLRWCYTAPWLAPHVYSHPAAVDVNGDGRRDVIFTDWNTIGHKPGKWEPVSPAHLFALSSDGHLLWKIDLSIGWSNKDPIVVDADGDGKQEILVVNQHAGSEGVAVHALDGRFERFLPAPSGWGVTRGPQAADLDGDGYLEIVVPIWRASQGCPVKFDVGCREGALQIWSTRGTEAAFPGNFYFNHEYEVAYDGKAPKAPRPPNPTPAPKTGTLAGVVGDDDGPLRGAKVRAHRGDEEFTARTDSAGRYSMRLASGFWNLTVTAFGHLDNHANATVLGLATVTANVTLTERPGLEWLPNLLPMPWAAAGGAMVVLAGAAGLGWWRWRR